jgi:hypothetical protein
MAVLLEGFEAAVAPVDVVVLQQVTPDVADRVADAVSTGPFQPTVPADHVPTELTLPGLELR